MLSLLLSLLVASAHAGDDDARARELYENGAILYDEGRYEDAVAAWSEAYRLSNRPGLLFNIANAEERLGRYQEALDHLNRYRAFAEESERETLDRRIANLERRLEAVRAEAAANPTTTPPPTEPVVTTPSPPPPVEKKAKLSPLPFVLFGVGGASAITGGVFGGMAVGARSDAGGACTAVGDQTYCPESASTALQRDHTDSLLADVFFGVAAASAIGGVVTLVLPQHTALGATWIPGGGTFTFQGHF